MIVRKVKNKISKWLKKIIAVNNSVYKLALRIYRLFNSQRMRREYYERMKHIEASEYLDLSYKPDLNVVILVIDCLPNSRLSCQGYFRRTTPFLDSLKSRFSAISAAPWTYPSVASIL